MIAWLAGGGTSSLRSHVLGERDVWGPTPDLPLELQRRADLARQGRLYQEDFSGGSDSMHLIFHLDTALQQQTPGVEMFVASGSTTAHRSITGDGYGTLFTTLRSGAIPSITQGRSTRVDLVSRPIGWLGTYRKSRTTGFWFRGGHKWHMLGH